ncbi:MAG: hypothetical protein FGF53_03685 [Candidatus Brockarchaeota archaeon]|nr:hypothetical protein [Candidatus Brockarchaeota archaeon]MBO3809188.1 hypothetical protein [Candidatus Brockarchaeota archaeon]
MNAEQIRVFKGDRANTVKIVGSNGEFLEVIPKKHFPISNPYFLLFTDAQGNEISVVEDYRKMDGFSGELLKKFWGSSTSCL